MLQSFGNVFMQLMCPSCCGAFFSESTKGSVYTKRGNAGHRGSATKSDTVTIAEEIQSDASRIDARALQTTSMEGQRQLANDNTVMEEGVNGGDGESQKIAHRQIMPQKPNRQCTFVDDLKVSEDPGGSQCPQTSSKARPKLQRDITIIEEIDMLDEEPRRISLRDTINEQFINRSTKLRKTNYPSNDINGSSKSLDTVIELKIAGKEPVEVRKQDNGTEPPYNFQAILRKTNSTRHSLRRLAGACGDGNDDSNYIIVELKPGVVLHGQVYDL